jgi:hypothetical protein
MKGKKRGKIAYYSFQSKHKKRHTPIADKLNSKYSNAGPGVIPVYTGNPSDSEDSDNALRNALGERIRSMKASLTENERRIINYIISKRHPVYSFMQFSFDKNKK